MGRFLPVIIEVGLLLYALIDCVQTDERRVKHLPKLLWMLVILIPFAGPIAWLFAGKLPRGIHPGEAPREVSGYQQPPRPASPDDDPAFLAKLRAEAERQRKLKAWEDDLKRREQELRGDGEQPPPSPTA